MSGRPPTQGVPTLTEVIDVIAMAQRPDPVPATVTAPAPEPLAPRPSADELTLRVLADVQRQVDVMLEHRLREALMPALLRATDALILEVRTELAITLQALVARAVEQALARHHEP